MLNAGVLKWVLLMLSHFIFAEMFEDFGDFLVIERLPFTMLDVTSLQYILAVFVVIGFVVYMFYPIVLLHLYFRWVFLP